MSKATQQNIKKLLSLTGATHKELAKIADVDRTSVSHWIRGKAEPRMGALQNLADHYGIRISDLIDSGGMDRYEKGLDGKLHRTNADLSAQLVYEYCKQILKHMARIGDVEEPGRQFVSADVISLLEAYSSLNDDGKRMALATISAFVASGNYTKQD